MEYIDFTGTAYLGLNNNAAFMDLIYKGIETYGINFGGSRHNNAVPDIYNMAEDFFSEKFHCEDSLICSSGTLAGILIAGYLKKNSYKLYISNDLHPALKCNFSSYPEFKNLYELLDEINTGGEHNTAILLNTVNPVTLNTVDLDALLELKKADNIIFVFDDSHGIGIRGDDNWGIGGFAKKNGLKYVILSSLAKAFSLEGGVLAGERSLIDNIKTGQLWGGASPPPPFYFYALIRGESIFQKQMNRLKQNILYFKSKLRSDTGFRYIDDFPVFVNTGTPVYKELLENGIRISAFSYPTKNDPLTERIVINSNHSFEDLDSVLNYI